MDMIAGNKRSCILMSWTGSCTRWHFYTDAKYNVPAWLQNCNGLDIHPQGCSPREGS